jgi:hypothetical protein
VASEYDTIVIGAGYNNLTCGCYLAKAGLKVIEQYDSFLITHGIIAEYWIKMLDPMKIISNRRLSSYMIIPFCRYLLTKPDMQNVIQKRN